MVILTPQLCWTLMRVKSLYETFDLLIGQYGYKQPIIST